MTNIALTRGQKVVYDYLREHWDEWDNPPTLDELCEGLGLSSRGSLHKHITALARAGLIEPLNHRQRGIRLRAPDDPAGVPFLGYIAAGQPIEALENPERIEVPEHLLGRGENYVLQVRGNSMVDAGILDGDWVVIERRRTARDGEIVVALIDGEEATLKRIEQRRREVILHPANRRMKALRYAPDRVRIQGVLVGQMRAY